MREYLRNYDWHCYGLQTQDFNYVVDLAAGLVADRKAAMALTAERVRAENPFDSEDILDDTLYYSGLDVFFIWESCIIRLIGIFEGFVERSYLPAGRYSGYRSRVQALERAGYCLKDGSKINEWVRLRNAIAHNPPEQFRPAIIEEADVRELCDLLMNACSDLEKQKRF